MNKIKEYIVEFERTDSCACKTAILKKSYQKDFTESFKLPIAATSPSRAIMTVNRFVRYRTKKIKESIQENGFTIFRKKKIYDIQTNIKVIRVIERSDI